MKTVPRRAEQGQPFVPAVLARPIENRRVEKKQEHELREIPDEIEDVKIERIERSAPAINKRGRERKHGPVGLMIRQAGKRPRVGEEEPGIPQVLDIRIVDEDVDVVEMKSIVKMIGIGP